MLDADALERAVRARRVAEELGRRLRLIGYRSTPRAACARALGDPAEGLALLRRALAIALAAEDDEGAGRAFANLQASLVTECRFDEAGRVTSEGLLFCEDHDLATYGLCLRGGELAGAAGPGPGRLDRAERRGRELPQPARPPR